MRPNAPAPRMLLAAAAAAALSAAAMPVAATTTLTFDGDICSAASDGTGAFSSCSNSSFINQAYGDSAEAEVGYSSASSAASPSSMSFWLDSYSGLTRVAYGGVDPAVTIVPTAGNQVQLLGFDLGAWPNANRQSQVTVTDLGTGVPILSTGPITVLGSTPTSFSFASAVSTGGFSIRFGPDGFNVGIDNIAFLAGPVPEPGTALLLAAGVALLGGRRLRRTTG